MTPNYVDPWERLVHHFNAVLKELQQGNNGSLQCYRQRTRHYKKVNNTINDLFTSPPLSDCRMMARQKDS